MKNKWDHRFMSLAKHVATWSKDPSTQVGAVIVNQSRIVVGLGYNGFPRGVSDDQYILEDRPAKLARTVHAEVNAIMNASSSTVGATLYSTLASCSNCTALIIQAGIRGLVYPPIPPVFLERWGESFYHSRSMLTEAGVTITELDAP